MRTIQMAHLDVHPRTWALSREGHFWLQRNAIVLGGGQARRVTPVFAKVLNLWAEMRRLHADTKQWVGTRTLERRAVGPKCRCCTFPMRSSALGLVVPISSAELV
eukprot:COSAG02_NODE_43811_length_371_cov_1.099265_1_plen_104_part_01